MKDDIHDPRAIVESLVLKGRREGADILVSSKEGNEFTVEVRNGQIEKLVQAVSRGIFLKVIRDGRVATASSTDLSKETLNRLLEDTLARAALTSPDPAAGLPDFEPLGVDLESLAIFDPQLLKMTPEEKIRRALETEAPCLRDPRIGKSFGATFETQEGTIHLALSNGFYGSYRRTHCACGVSLQAGEGENLIDEGWSHSARRLEDLLPPEKIAEKAVHRVTRLIGARKVDTQNVPVVFEPEMTAELLGFLYTCLSGRNIYLNQSFLAGRLNESIGNGRLTVIDDGLIPRAAGTRPFDAEGVAVRRKTVIEKGVLRHYLLDTYAARKLGMRSTGNASGPNNFFLQAGDTPPEAILRSVDRGLLLTQTIGFGFVPTTGDLSRGAFGLWIEKGEPVFPVAEITISANLGTLLHEIEAVGNDLELDRAISGPTIKVAEMTVGGR